MIRTILVLLFLGVANFLVLPFFILWSTVTGNPDLMYGVAMAACRGACRIAGMRVRVEGLENIPPGVCIFTPNHVSNLDPLAFIPRIPRRVTVLIKQELFRIPVLATGMRMVRFVPVRRNDRESIAASVAACREVLPQGLSLVIFAEGTRSRDGRLRPFKKGAFVLGIEAGVPIVPVSISGTQALMVPGKASLRPGEVTVRIGAAVDASQYAPEQRPALTARVEALVAAGLPPDQQPLTTLAEAPDDSAE